MDLPLADLRRETAGVAADFGHALIDSALIAPYDGVAQVANHLSRRQILPVAEMATSRPMAFGDPHWQAQQLGNCFGLALQIGVCSKIFGKVLGAEAESQAMLLRPGIPLGNAALTGFAMGSLLQPTADGENFWSTRLRNGATGAATLFTLSAAGQRLDNMSRASRGLSIPGVALPFETELRNGIFSGALAGGVSAESNSILSGRGPASMHDIAGGAYTLALTGGVLGGMGRLQSEYRQQSANYVKTQDVASPPIRSTLLTSLARTEPGLQPLALSEYVDALPKSGLGLPRKNLELATWTAPERARLFESLQRDSSGIFADEKNVSKLVASLDRFGVDHLGKRLATERTKGADGTATEAELASAIEKSLAETLASHDMASPTVALKQDLPVGVAGMYEPGKGRLVLNEHLFSNGLSSEAVEFLTHEGTHLDQDVLKIRHAISQAHLTNPISSAVEHSNISTVYGSPVDLEFANKVFSASGGRPLTASETQRLQDLTKSREEFATGHGVHTIMQIDTAFRSIASELANGGPHSESLTADVSQLLDLRNTAVDRYVGARFEREAWSNGLLAHIKARAMGVPAPAKEPTIFDNT